MTVILDVPTPKTTLSDLAPSLFQALESTANLPEGITTPAQLAFYAEAKPSKRSSSSTAKWSSLDDEVAVDKLDLQNNAVIGVSFAKSSKGARSRSFPLWQ